jgi:hypothetical protein
MVFVDQSAEDVGAFDVSGRRDGRAVISRRGDRDLEVDAAVRPAGVVVQQVGGQDPFEMAPIPDQ